MKHNNYVIDEGGELIGKLGYTFKELKPVLQVPIQQELIQLCGPLYKQSIVLDKVFQNKKITLWQVLEKDRGIVNCIIGFTTVCY